MAPSQPAANDTEGQLARAINPDKNRPAAPDQSHKFRESKVHGHFVDRYRAFQWSKGYDLRVSASAPSAELKQVVLECATSIDCHFVVSATLWTYSDGPGYGVDSHPFEPQHNHPPPYQPLDLAVENDRRMTLLITDPSLTWPPFVRASSTSAGEPMDQDPQMEGEFLAILRSADPSFIKYLPSLEKAGLGPTTTLKDLEDVSDEDLLGALREVEGLPALVAYVVFDAIGRARRDQEKGGPDVAEEKARSQAREKAREWVLARVQVK